MFNSNDELAWDAELASHLARRHKQPPPATSATPATLAGQTIADALGLCTALGSPEWAESVITVGGDYLDRNASDLRASAMLTALATVASLVRSATKADEETAAALWELEASEKRTPARFAPSEFAGFTTMGPARKDAFALVHAGFQIPQGCRGDDPHRRVVRAIVNEVLHRYHRPGSPAPLPALVLLAAWVNRELAQMCGTPQGYQADDVLAVIGLYLAAARLEHH